MDDYVHWRERMTSVPGYRAPSVARALKILEVVAQAGEGLGISDLARKLDISKGTVSGICSQLESQGALVREPVNKRYLLGPFVAALAGMDPVYARLKRAARPELSSLRDDLGESFFMGVAAGRHVTVVEAKEAPGVMGISAGPGTKLPLCAGAVGKALLADPGLNWQEKQLEKKLKPYTPQSITDPEVYERELEKVRRDGFALEQNEFLTGVWGVAVSLGESAGVPAAVWSVGFTSSLRPGSLERVCRGLVRARANILAELA